MTITTVKYRLFVAWNGVDFTDESAYLISAQGANRLAPPSEPGLSSRGQVDEATLTLDNSSGRYSPLDTTGDLYAYIQAGGAYHRPMYLEVSVNSGTNYYRVFTGVIKLPQESTPTGRETASVSIRCRSNDELLLARKMSTLLSAMQVWSASGYRDGEMIEALLLNANVIDYEADVGTIPIPYAWLDDESVLDEIWQIAGASGGRFYCDADGMMRYEDATHWLKSPHNTSQETFTRASYGRCLPAYSDNDLYNSITVETSPRQVDTVDVLWEPDELISIAPGETKNVTARLKQAAWQIDPITITATTAAGLDISADVTATAGYPKVYVQRVELSYTNANATHTAYLRPLSISGKALKGGPTQEVSKNSTDDGTNAAWWTARNSSRNKTVRGNPYIQTESHAGSVALMLLHRSEAARLSYRMTDCIGKPTRRCGDRITINDTAIMSAARQAFVTAISWRLGAQGFYQDIEAVDAAQLYPYADSPGYFILGDGDPASSKVGTGTGSAYLWY